MASSIAVASSALSPKRVPYLPFSTKPSALTQSAWLPATRRRWASDGGGGVRSARAALAAASPACACPAARTAHWLCPRYPCCNTTRTGLIERLAVLLVAVQVAQRLAHDLGDFFPRLLFLLVYVRKTAPQIEMILESRIPCLSHPLLLFPFVPRKIVKAGADGVGVGLDGCAHRRPPPRSYSNQFDLIVHLFEIIIFK